MAIGLTVKNIERGSRRKRTITYSAAFSGTYATGGDTLDFTSATAKPGGVNQFPYEAPENIMVQGAAGFEFERLVGTLPSNCKLKLFSSSGLLPEYTYSAADLKGATAAAGTEDNADQAAGPVNEAVISALATFTATAGTLTIANQPDLGRNVIVVIKNDSGGPLNLFEGTTPFVVTGKFRGAAQVETINLTSTGANKAVANTKFRYKAGLKPFDSITSITYTNPADGGLKIEVAPGVKIGLPINSATGADADFIKVMVTAADYAFAGKIDYTNWTLATATTADAWDLLVEYKPAAGEWPNGLAYPATLVAAQANMEIVATFRGL